MSAEPEQHSPLHQMLNGNDDDCPRLRHLDDMRKILSLRISQSSKVNLTAPFDQAVPGCYSMTEAVLPMPTAIGTSASSKRSPQMLKGSPGSVNGFRQQRTGISQSGPFQDQDDRVSTKPNRSTASHSLEPEPLHSSVGPQGSLKHISPRNSHVTRSSHSPEPKPLHSSVSPQGSLKNMIPLNKSGRSPEPLHCSSFGSQGSSKFLSPTNNHVERVYVSRMPTKYLSYMDSQSIQAYTAESSALIHLSQGDFVAELFKFGEGSKLLTSCSLLENKAGDYGKLDVVVALPNKDRVRYTLLDEDTVDSIIQGGSSDTGINEGDSVVVYYSCEGSNAAMVRPEDSKINGFFVVSSRSHGCCQVTLTTEVKMITSSLHISKAMKLAVLLLKTAYDAFYRGEEIDNAAEEEFVRSIPSAPDITPQERHFLSSTSKTLVEGAYKKVWTGDSSTDAYEVFVKKDATMGKVNKRVATIHVSAGRLLAWRFAYNNYDNMKNNKINNHDLFRYGYDIPDSHSRLVGGSIYFPGVSNRRFNQVFTWEKVENFQNRGSVAYILVICPQIKFIVPGETEPKIPPISKGLIQGITLGYMSFEELSPNICRMTLIQWADFGGLLGPNISDLIRSRALRVVKALQQKYARKKAVVDAERRDHFAAKLKDAPPLSSCFNEEKLGIVAAAMALEQEYVDSPVVSTKIHSQSALVPMAMKTISSKNGDRSVVTGQASCVVDVSAELATAQIVRFSSREGHPTQFQVQERGMYDSTFVYIRRVPKPLTQREFMFRIITHRHDADVDASDESSSPSSRFSYSVAVVSTDEIADYGIKIKSIRAVMVTNYTATPTCNNDQCRVVTTQKIHSGGVVPLLDFSKQIGQALSILYYIRLALHRDAEVDRLERMLVTDTMKKYDREGHQMMYTQDDKALVARVSERFLQPRRNGINTHVVKNLSSDALIETSSLITNDGSISFLSEFVVDSSVEEVAAFTFCLKSRFLSEAFYKGGEKINIEEVSPHRQTVMLTIKPKAKEVGHNNSFEFRTTMAWKRGEGEGDYYNLVSEPFGDPSLTKSRGKTFTGRARKMTKRPQTKASQVLPLAMVVGDGSSVIKKEKRGEETVHVADSKQWSYVRLERVVGGGGDGEGIEGVQDIPQTSVKFYTQLRLAASIQSDDANILSHKQHFGTVGRLRKFFDRSAELDHAARSKFVATRSEVCKQEYSAEEEAIIARGIHRFNDFEMNAKMRYHKAVSPLATNRIGKKTGDIQYGLSVTNMRASPLEIIAYNWNFMSRQNAKKESINKQLVEEVNDHNIVIYVEKVTPTTLSNRDFLVRMLWKKLDVVSTGGNEKKVYFFVIENVERDTFVVPNSIQPIRAPYTVSMKLTQTSERDTKVEYLLHLGLGVDLTKSVLFRKGMTIFLNYNLQRTVRLQQYFQELVELDDLDEKDGIEIGETLIICRNAKTKKSIKLSAEKEIKKHVALVELSEECSWFEPMLVHITAMDLGFNFFSASVGTLNKRNSLEVISTNDGQKLANFLRQMILTSVNQGLATQRFRESIAMDELIKAHPFMGSMISTMCDRIVTEHTVYKVFQCFKKVAFSVADVGSDIFIAVIYYNSDGDRSDGSDGRDTANALFVIILVSMTIQLFLCFLNHLSNWRVMLKEMFYTVTFVRGGVLHMRVLTKQKPHGHALIDILNESSYYRTIEVAFESIPGAYIQLSAILTEGGSVSALKYFSLAISIGVVCLSVSNLDYRKDSDFKSRFIPGQGFRKFAVVSLMKALCLTQFCIRIGFCSLIGTRSSLLLLMVMSGEFALYLAAKLVRSDLVAWFPVTGISSVVFTLVSRFGMLELNAATSVLQARHPYESGGITWIMVHVATHAELLYVAFNLDFLNVRWSSSDLLQISSTLVTAWWIIFCLMLLFGEAKYRHTFFSRQTAPQYQKHIFQTGTDMTKSRFFTKHRSYWVGFTGDIVDWLGDNWIRWEHEGLTIENAHFTKDWKLKVQALNLMSDGVGGYDSSTSSKIGGSQGKRSGVETDYDEEEEEAITLVKGRRNTRPQVVVVKEKEQQK